MKEKDQSIETLRGFAILLVVGGYIILNDITAAAHRSPVSSGLRFFHYFFTPIRMPLFTVISAYLYAVSPATRETFKKLVTGKARRIMIPFLAVSTIQYIIYAFLPLESHPQLHEIYRIYIWPHEQLWFLYSIFEIFIIVGAMDAFGILKTPARWAGALAVSSTLSLFYQAPHAFSLYGVNYLMPFFLMGYGMRRYPEIIFSPSSIKKLLWTALICGLGWTFLYAKPVLPPLAHQMVGLVISFSAVPLLFHYRQNWPLLAKIGYYSFGIHIFNRIVISSLRAFFEKNQIDNTGLQFISYMVCGVAFAVAIQLLLERFSLTRKYILGLKDKSGPEKDIRKKPAVDIIPPVLVASGNGKLKPIPEFSDR